MNGCGSCGCQLDVIASHVGRRDTCTSCGADLHACQQCRHFDEGAAKECKEPFAEVPDDKVSANFCDLFQIGEGRARGGGTSKEVLLNAAESLFRKQ
jgi:hypothetical protein